MSWQRKNAAMLAGPSARQQHRQAGFCRCGGESTGGEILSLARMHHVSYLELAEQMMRSSSA